MSGEPEDEELILVRMNMAEVLLALARLGNGIAQLSAAVGALAAQDRGTALEAAERAGEAASKIFELLESRLREAGIDPNEALNEG